MPSVRILKGKLKCPIITLWIVFGIHLTYLIVVFALKKYISLIYLILDIEILFNVQLAALFVTLSDHKNNFKLYLISFFMSLINTLVILLSIFIITYAFFYKTRLIEFINAEPWIKNEGNIWIGGSFIFEKVFEIIPLIILSIYFKNIGKSLGVIEPGNINDDNMLFKEKSDDTLA